MSYLRLHYSWFNRLLGFVSIFLALICLYFALSIVAEKLLSRELQKRLQAAQIESQEALIKWSGKSLCAYGVRFRAPQHHIDAEIQSLCAGLTFRPSWPFLGLHEISVDQANIWVSLSSNSKPKDTLIKQEPNQWKRLEAQLSQTFRSIEKVKLLWSQLFKSLHKLDHNELRISKSTLRIRNPKQADSLMILSGSAQLTQKGAFVQLSSPFHEGISRWQLSPNMIRLDSDLKLIVDSSAMLSSPFNRLATAQFVVSKGTQLTYPSLQGTNIKAIGLVQIEHEQLWTLPKALQFTFQTQSQGSLGKKKVQFIAESLKSNHRFGAEFSMEKHKLKYIDLSMNKVLVPSRLFSFTLNSTDPSKTHLETANMIQVDALVKIEQEQLNGQVSFNPFTVSLPSLPKLTWPFLKLEGSVSVPRLLWTQLPFLKAETDLKKQVLNWKTKNLTLSLGNQDGMAIQAWLDIELDYDPSQTFEFDRLKKLDLNLSVNQSSCQSLFKLLPSALLGPIQSAKLSGTVKPLIDVQYQRLSSNPEDTKVNLNIQQLLKRCKFDQLTLNQPNLDIKQHGQIKKRTDVEWLNENFTYTIDPIYTEGKTIKVGPETKDFVPLDELPSYVGGAMYLTEETGFWRGGAFSVALLNRALNTNLKKRSFVYGGSTITQQLVKNLFLDRDKTLTRKVREALISARIIDQISKKRVLELYLNMIEFGPKVFGIQAASKYYFQKDSRDLSPEEAIFLAMLKVSPKRGATWIKRGYSPKFTWWRNRSVEIFDRLVKEGLVSEARAKGAAPFVLKWSEAQYLGYQKLD